LTMPQSLICEMAQAATNGKGKLSAWVAEMARVRRLGAPMSPYEIDAGDYDGMPYGRPILPRQH
jgi:hypothetical protein